MELLFDGKSMRNSFSFFQFWCHVTCQAAHYSFSHSVIPKKQERYQNGKKLTVRLGYGHSMTDPSGDPFPSVSLLLLSWSVLFSCRIRSPDTKQFNEGTKGQRARERERERDFTSIYVSLEYKRTGSFYRTACAS